MFRTRSGKLIIGVVIAAVFYQYIISDLLIGALGYGRSPKSISTYTDYNCERIEEPGLEACEDMWLHEETGHLYLACSETKTRLSWMPP